MIGVFPELEQALIEIEAAHGPDVRAWPRREWYRWVMLQRTLGITESAYLRLLVERKFREAGR